MNRWVTLLLFAALASGEGRAESPKPVDPLNDVRFLVGRWSGSSEGQAGRGSVSRIWKGTTQTDTVDGVVRFEPDGSR